MKTIPSCLALGPGVITAGGLWPGIGETDGERRWWGVCSRLVALYLERGPLEGGFFLGWEEVVTSEKGQVK